MGGQSNGSVGLRNMAEKESCPQSLDRLSHGHHHHTVNFCKPSGCLMISLKRYLTMPTLGPLDRISSAARIS